MQNKVEDRVSWTKYRASWTEFFTKKEKYILKSCNRSVNLLYNEARNDTSNNSERLNIIMNPIFAMGFGGPYDIAIIGGIVILLFGGAKIAGFGKSLGQGIRDFKQAAEEDKTSSQLPLGTGNTVTKLNTTNSGTAGDQNNII